MEVTGQDIVTQIEAYAPLILKMNHDPSGLQLGDLRRPVHRVLTTLDVRPEVVQEAITNQVDFIFAHHPLIFHPVVNLDTTIPQNAMYAELLKHDITVYAAHSNMDKTCPGMNDWLAQALKLQQLESFARDNDGVGLGRVGLLSTPMTCLELAKYVKQVFHLGGLRLITPDINKVVQRIGIIGGDGGKFYLDALEDHIDVFITGDVYYHTAHDMLSAGLSVIDPGHHIESIFKIQTAKLLEHWAHENKWSITVQSSQLLTEPYQFI